MILAQLSWPAIAACRTPAAGAFGQIRTSPRGGMSHACAMELNPARVCDDGTAGETGRRPGQMLRLHPGCVVRHLDELSASGMPGRPIARCATGELEFDGSA